MTNWLGLFVLLSIFVLSHVVAAIASFRMISLIPHHIPRMIGFSSANRVDMDEFSRGAALIGANETLSTVRKSLSPKQLTSEGGNSGGQGGQKQIGSSGTGKASPNNTEAGSPFGVDTTLRATMDMGGGSNEPEDE